MGWGANLRQEFARKGAKLGQILTLQWHQTTLAANNDEVSLEQCQEGIRDSKNLVRLVVAVCRGLAGSPDTLNLEQAIEEIFAGFQHFVVGEVIVTTSNRKFVGVCKENASVIIDLLDSFFRASLETPLCCPPADQKLQVRVLDGKGGNLELLRDCMLEYCSSVMPLLKDEQTTVRRIMELLVTSSRFVVSLKSEFVLLETAGQMSIRLIVNTGVSLALLAVQLAVLTVQLPVLILLKQANALLNLAAEAANKHGSLSDMWLDEVELYGLLKSLRPFECWDHDRMGQYRNFLTRLIALKSEERTKLVKGLYLRH